MSLADLSPTQIRKLVAHSHSLKRTSLPWLQPALSPKPKSSKELVKPQKSLNNKTVALLFSKRSTRTRVAAETATSILGGRALFLGKDDIQLGVNETPRDTARVLGGMCQGIFARVGKHEEVEELARWAGVPVVNALSEYWHPTQVLADLLTLQENAHLFDSSIPAPKSDDAFPKLPELPKLTIAYVGDPANVLNDMLVTYPRLGCRMQVASPNGYKPIPEVWNRVKELGCDEGISWSDDPREAVKGADVVITDTWISMGQENEKAQRLQDFEGYQVTEKLCAEGGANPNWKFMHCLPRKQNEVDDEVFYGDRSLVFPEADNRKWTIMGVFDSFIGRWSDGGKDKDI